MGTETNRETLSMESVGALLAAGERVGLRLARAHGAWCLACEHPHMMSIDASLPGACEALRSQVELLLAQAFLPPAEEEALTAVLAALRESTPEKPAPRVRA